MVLPYWLDRPDLEALGIAHQASACGFERLWLGEMATFDVFALATAVANSTSIPRLTVGPLAVGVRSPVAIAMGAASVATLTGTHVDVALGASSPHIVSDWHDRSWSGNPQRTRESVAVLRELLGGGRAAFSGRHIRTRGFRLRRPQPDSTISVAAFGPRMTRVAAETADEVVLNLVAPEHIAQVRASIDAFAEARGLPAPRLAVWVTCSVEPRPDTYHQLASQLAVYLRPPGYGEMFTELGFGSLVRTARSTAGRHTLVPEIPPSFRPPSARSARDLKYCDVSKATSTPAPTTSGWCPRRRTTPTARGPWLSSGNTSRTSSRGRSGRSGRPTETGYDRSVTDTPEAQPTDSRGDDSVTRTLNLVGERWTMLILREAFFGVHRYGQFAQNLGIPRPTLSNRLGKLVDVGLLIRERYAGGPIRSDYEYRLTQAGLDLFPAIQILMEWGNTYLPDEPAGSGSKVAWTHDVCGSPTHPRLTCDQCGEPVTAHNVHLTGDTP
ncbi:hypothetical protein SSPO_098850 [Streptomyces antimycoticus]|uniref:HTH hxlR-type domain-containing protein n=1 Tax=Streptomyces antimycoticus TaxID=68175 RepID=A0A499VLU2_9ACTN|nr:LLM class F420-dependent oxidoreductase [Streptomyces antimycoticus]BBJ47167.1 hypothetical protein SSPO_098850 [Streptomyces antimycoticus]